MPKGFAWEQEAIALIGSIDYECKRPKDELVLEALINRSSNYAVMRAQVNAKPEPPGV